MEAWFTMLESLAFRVRQLDYKLGSALFTLCDVMKEERKKEVQDRIIEGLERTDGENIDFDRDKPEETKAEKRFQVFDKDDSTTW